jgi:hypothetical protein
MITPMISMRRRPALSAQRPKGSSSEANTRV